MGNDLINQSPREVVVIHDYVVHNDTYMIHSIDDNYDNNSDDNMIHSSSNADTASDYDSESDGEEDNVKDYSKLPTTEVIEFTPSCQDP